MHTEAWEVPESLAVAAKETLGKLQFESPVPKLNEQNEHS